ncbi:hypothetical protein BGW36DRAFT_394558 [Talaromyces proteolyticus]|uniref:Zinc finger PHD-type domain-containing protein n=1 Tax=Talaromyces proteolyticus TaxID=1131652 RepID=A0AAD4Q3G2_9EURO|nr:uncharacterized protein BGW36DRAFT_394558 [Talaromyces proteolyticus]KAH8701738.1 hypothetical protein BGW36DRAFT_394558 [Talaromyces proteolyticus]
MSPRRSSRARTTQPSPALLQHTNSNSSSGNSLGRGERSTRSNHKLSSPQGSQSLDESDGKPDLPQTRQRQHAQDDDSDDLPKGNEDADADDDENEEEEITRCLCGQQEYPGLPPLQGNPVGGKESSKIATTESDPLSDEIGSMFIQCDSCKVWQHGGCVGIMDEAMSPDEYFCEQCRKDLHKITSEPNGQFSSQYLPVAPVASPRSPSRESSRDTSRPARDSKSRQSDNPKRRSTMNSRDAAYDEEELLRRAIEESKEETRMSNDETGSRRTKRSRSDSEAHKEGVKRPRTSSQSPSGLSNSNPASQPVSEDEEKARLNGANRPKRAPPARNQRDKETKEPEEQETERPETATRRKSRSEKRKGDESDHEIEASPTKPPASVPVPNEPEPSETAPETPIQPAEPVPPPRQSIRKSGRPPARRGGRVGRNQYTRDRDTNGDSINSPNSPHGGQYRDNGRDSPNMGGPNGIHANGTETGKAGKARHLNPHRTSMNEMKRRVAAILDFISRMQVEMAASGETVTPPDGNGSGNENSSRTALVKGVQEQLGNLLSMNGEGASTDGSTASVTDGEVAGKERDFKDLSSVEMMDVLTRHLLKWQQEYGKYGEK